MEWENFTDEDAEKFAKQVSEQVESFKDKLKKVCEDIVSETYYDIIPYAYGDALTNFRNSMLDEIVAEKPRLLGHHQEKIRQLIWVKHKAEIIPLLDKDLLDENERLRSIVDEYYKNSTDYSRKFL